MADAFEASSKLFRGFLSGVQRPRHHLDGLLDRIERTDSKLHAFVAVYAEAARAVADAAEASFKNGYSIGPMTGVPFALKDIVDVAGQVTAGGSAAMADRVPTQTAVIGDRLLGAGGVLVGKTHTVEVAMGGWGTNQRLGAPWNPWDLTTARTPGGSSSGSGVAVAAGLVPFAIGTDTGGSVRLPAAWNGIVGLKITEGVVPTDGIIPLSHTLDTPGPMARSVEDCALGFEILRGVEPRKVLGDLLDRQGVFGELTRGMAGLVLGAMPDSERVGVDPEVLDAYDQSLADFAARGAVIKPVDLPRAFDSYKDRSGVITAAEAYFYHGRLFEDGNAAVDEDVRPRILHGRDLSAQSYLGALHGRLDDQAAFLKSIAGVDAILTPTIATAAEPIDGVDQGSTPARFTRAGNYLGLCGVSVPNGRTTSGLPTSLQILGRGHAEPLVLRIAADLELSLIHI